MAAFLVPVSELEHCARSDRTSSRVRASGLKVRPRFVRCGEAAIAATEAATPLFEPDFEVVLVRSDIERATYRGFEGLRSAWIDWLEPWESCSSEVEELVDLGDRVAVLVRDYGRRKGMEREVDAKGVAV
jgi:ketosteroid isomerase-like protein